jgi:CRP/FNR family cyclic AMP-dependent transcriptional regulator
MPRRSDDPYAPLDFFNRIDDQTTRLDYENRQEIFTQGQPADALYFVHSGFVKLTVTAKDGKKAVIAILHKGDFFGEGCLVKKSTRMSTATAVQPCSIARVNRAKLARIINSNASFSKLFISHLLLRIGLIEGEFVDQIFSSSEKRLARILLTMAGFSQQTELEPVVLKVSQETLAEMVGTTRSRVSYFMNRFRKLGFIDYNGSVHVHPSLLTFLNYE